MFVEGASDGTLNGTTPVTIVAAPGSGVRRVVRSLVISNVDTADVELTLSYDHNGSGRVLWSGTLAPGDTLSYDGAIVLDDTDKSIEAVLGEAVQATEPDYVATWGDAS